MAIDLGKQVGPLPLGAWIAVVGGGLAIAYASASSRNSGSDDPIYVNDTSGTPGVGVGGFGAYTSTDGGTSPITQTNAAITSNAQWGQSAFQFLVAMGTDGAVADKAVRDYLSGVKLSLQANALISLALAKLGQPPEGLPDAPELPTTPTPVSRPPAPRPPVVRRPRSRRPIVGVGFIRPGPPRPPTPPPAPVFIPPPPPSMPTPPPQTPQQRRYTVVRSDSLWKIAARFYGQGSRWPEIYNANRSVIGGNPNRIYPGQVLVIP